MKNSFQIPDKFDITVTCASGVERTLKTELNRLGYDNVPAVNGTLTFSGDCNAVAKCNINLRTADRVYIKVGEFSAESFDDLFEGVYALPWQDFFPADAKITVNGKCVKSKLFAVSACQSVVKKSIMQKLSIKYGLSYFNENGSEYRVEFWLYKNVASLLINTSGAGLHKRGYRDLVGIAPIKETLASALLLMSDFYKKRPFIDPFCGSGTFVIEGAMIALDIAPGLNRKFDFNDWKNFDKRFYDLCVEEAENKKNLSEKISFCGYDIDKKAIALANRHSERAGLKGKVSFEQRAVRYLESEYDFGTIVTNPPYGERVYDKEQAEECYKQFGEAFNKMNGWSAFVITSSKNFQRLFNKRADREKKIFNSNKECRYYYYYGKKENC